MPLLVSEVASDRPSTDLLAVPGALMPSPREVGTSTAGETRTSWRMAPCDACAVLELFAGVGMIALALVGTEDSMYKTIMLRTLSTCAGILCVMGCCKDPTLRTQSPGARVTQAEVETSTSPKGVERSAEMEAPHEDEELAPEASGASASALRREAERALAQGQWQFARSLITSLVERVPDDESIVDLHHAVQRMVWAAHYADRFWETGVAACDEVLRRYRSCVESTYPEPAQDSALQGLEYTLVSWKAFVAGGHEDVLLESCAAAEEHFRATAQRHGCQW